MSGWGAGARPHITYNAYLVGWQKLPVIRLAQALARRIRVARKAQRLELPPSDRVALLGRSQDKTHRMTGPGSPSVGCPRKSDPIMTKSCRDYKTYRLICEQARRYQHPHQEDPHSRETRMLIAVVLDSTALVRGLLNPNGPPGKIPDLIKGRDIQVAPDDRILGESEQVLSRPEPHNRPSQAFAVIGHFELPGKSAAAGPLSTDRKNRSTFHL